MKKIILLLACLTLLARSSHGQDAEARQDVATPKPVYAHEAKGEQDLVIAKPVEKLMAEKTIPDAHQKLTNAVLGKPLVYDGYFIQVLRAEKKRALFDLSTPTGPQKDSENVFFSSRPDVAQPIVLFRIKF